MRLVPRRAGSHAFERRALRGEHDVVDLALGGAEAPVDRKRAREIGGIAVELAAGVDQQQIAVAQHGVVGDVVQHAGVRAPATIGV